MSHSFQIKARIHSIKFATKGIITMLRTQHNAWLHSLATVTVSICGIGVHLARWEWCFVILAIMAVWIAEALNTALEFLADVASPEFHPLVEKAKDVAAGAVLIAALGAVIIGLLIFWPHLII
ncbi:MAG: diacylglycerol kinase family protein [Desulfobulbaceae bacterium]|nr:diacylglycerol kinase family protein [Desulfobulbaceae bacterium]